MMDMPAAIHRSDTLGSRRRGMARAMVAMGERKVSAVASASGMREAAANMQLTPAQPNSERPRCVAHAAPAKVGRSHAPTIENTSRAKKKRPALI